MKRVEMSAAGLAVLLERAEAFLRLRDITIHWMETPPPPSPLIADLIEASREARARLGLPPREPWTRTDPATATAEPEGIPGMEAPRRSYVCWRYEGALQRQQKAIVERALALENRYPGGSITDPVDAALVEVLMARAVAIESLLEDAEAHRHFVPALLPAWEMPPPTATELAPVMKDGC
jgi:hypothetical protein